jgi:hypothetical protein
MKASVGQPRPRRPLQLLVVLVQLLCSFTVAFVAPSRRSCTLQTKYALDAAADGINGVNGSDDSSSSNKSSSSGGGPANLIDKALFVEAVDSLQVEIAKQNDDTVSGATKQVVGPDASDGKMQKTDDGNDANKKETFYAIGKVLIKLDVSTGNPGMDLAEAANGLVLISSVTGLAAEAGLHMGDTIVFVEAVDAVQDTKAYNLEDTARVLMGAMKLAFNAGQPEIVLTVNRLVKMKYA